MLIKAFNAVGKNPVPTEWLQSLLDSIHIRDNMPVEDIQTEVQEALMKHGYYKTAAAYIAYREEHKNTKLIRDKINYILKYSTSSGNAATNSNTDANANNSVKNVSSIEPEVFKDKNRLIQRQLMKDTLSKLYPESGLGKQYIEDLNNHILYTHDEPCSPIPKAYCGAYTLYPLMQEGVGNIDAVTPTSPNDIQSFSGQVTNLIFALSAQTKGAVAVGDYMIALNYYVIKEFGPKWYDKLDEVICNSNVVDANKRTIRREIKKGMKQFIYGVNQPQGNRGFQSPFTNINIFDKYYFQSMFGEFYYPDGTQAEWKAVDALQRIFVDLLIEIRAIKPCTFPVVTFALLYDENGYKDKEYEQFCADEWAKGSSHFLYHSNNADSLSSCCRVSNKITENTFSSTTGMTGVMTGSCNVITLNINRITQDYFRSITTKEGIENEKKYHYQGLQNYIAEILERVYKYHIAYKTMLYELEEQGMISYSKANYLYIKKLYSTIGVLGYYEAAKFLGLADNSDEYVDFQASIMGRISKENKAHSIYDKKRPFIFNLEAVPGENLGVKLYNWDKADGYTVPADQNLYNCYFFNPWKENNVLTKLKMHGGRISAASDGGQGCHINLDTHLSSEQYKQVMAAARKYKCNYLTFNISISECKSCGHVVNGPVDKCPICGSADIDYWTRIIGFLRPISTWGKERQDEFWKRYFGKERMHPNN